MNRPVMFLLFISLLAGCSGTPIVGLTPEYPPVRIKPFSLFSEFVMVDSLQPTFRWHPFEIHDTTEKITHVIYELRVWTTNIQSKGKLVYERRHLTTPFHKIETALSPDTCYLWSVRANFLLGGRPRTTEWTLAGYTLRTEAVPNASCLRFKTPMKND